jgi:alcohol dehydrogenase (cytochrome c)
VKNVFLRVRYLPRSFAGLRAKILRPFVSTQIRLMPDECAANSGGPPQTGSSALDRVPVFVRSYTGLVSCLLLLALTAGTAGTAHWSNAEASTLPQTPSSPEPTFTQAQVDSGRSIYEKNCISCHGAQLEGGAGRALSGNIFKKNWEDGSRTLEEFYFVMRSTMPPTAPGSLTETQYLDVISFVLSKNGYAASSDPLIKSKLSVKLAVQSTQPAATQGVQTEHTTQSPTAAAVPPPALANAIYPIAPTKVEEATTLFPTDDDILRVDGANWMTYNRDLEGDRYSPLDQINVSNVSKLTVKCIFQLGEVGSFQNSPIIYKGKMYVNAKYRTYALDATTCLPLWQHTYAPQDPEHEQAAGRGVAFYQGKLYRGTSDGHVIAIDAATGKLLWDSRVTNAYLGFSISLAPVAYEGKVFVGESGADSGMKGRVFALDAKTGAVVWTFEVIPTGDEPGADSWPPEAAAHGGGSVWSTVTIDPKNHLVLVPTGNPGPDYNGNGRPGDNLYTDSVVALDIATGKLAWYVQQVPHDTRDWDTAAAPAIYDRGDRQYMAVASKEGHLFLYDRRTQKLIAKTETMGPRVNTDKPQSYTEPMLTCPGGHGQWNGAAYAPKTSMLFVGTEYRCTSTQIVEPRYIPGQIYSGGRISHPGDGTTTSGWIKGFDAENGKEIWSYKAALPVNSGMTTTAGGLLFAGERSGYLMAMDQKTGTILYQFMTGGSVAGGISTYAVDGKQYVVVASGNTSRSSPQSLGSSTILVFSLP